MGFLNSVECLVAYNKEKMPVFVKLSEKQQETMNLLKRKYSRIEKIFITN